MTPSILGPIPEHVLRLIPNSARKPLGKAGLTMPELSAKAAVRREKELKARVLDLLENHRGLVVGHADASKRSRFTVGWPDLTFCYKGQACAIELKRPGEKASADQLNMMSRMIRDGWLVAVCDCEMQVKEFLRELEGS